MRADGQDAFGEIGPRQIGHHDIDQHQVNGKVFTVRHAQSALGVMRHQDVVITALQHAFDHAEYGEVVVYHKNRLWIGF